MDDAHKIVELTVIVPKEVRAVPCCDVIRVGYDSELAVSKATQAMGLEVLLQVLLGPKDTPSTLNDLLEIGKGRLHILCGVEAQSCRRKA